MQCNASLTAAQRQPRCLPYLHIVQALLLLAAILTSFQLAAAQTVIITRHAEKAAAPSNDPPLTPDGMHRAKLLASMFENSGVTAIYVTDTLRTQQTAQPLAEATHLKPTMLPANDIAGLLKALRADHHGVVVVINHSNRIPEIIRQLGGPAVTINDNDYENLFVLTLEDKGAVLLRMHYGRQVPALLPAKSGQ